MMRGLVAGLALGCAGPAPAQSLPASSAPAVSSAQQPPPVDLARHRITLPTAVQVLTEHAAAAVHVVGSETGLWLDGNRVGSANEVLERNRLTRLDPLFDGLKARRAAWRAQHPDEAFCGCVVLWFDRATPLLVFKSVFQTAAFAGYPNLIVAVRPHGAGERTIAYKTFDAHVPGPEPRPLADGFTLHVDALADGSVQLVWRIEDAIERSNSLDDSSGPRSERMALLARRVDQEWRAYGGHPAPEDSAVDQAVLRAASSLDLATAVALMDAIHAPQRTYVSKGRAIRMPAFNVTFHVN